MISLFRRPQEGVRAITSHTAGDALGLLAQSPALNALAGARLEEIRSSLTLGREFSGLFTGGEITAVLWHGVSLSLYGSVSPAELDALADRALMRNPRFSSITGDSAAVRDLFTRLRDRIQKPRDERWRQPLLAASAAPQCLLSEELRPARPQESELVYPAAVAMFIEEVGVDPTRFDGGRSYRARVQQMIRERRTYIVRRGDELVFKADVGALFQNTAQIHGVWTDPAHRGQGIAREAMAALVPLVRADHASEVTLYVNDFNTPARRAYDAAGFRQVGEVATLLF